MLPLEWYDYLRFVTASQALLALYVSCRRAFYMWSFYTSRLRDLWWVMTVFLILTVEGSLEKVLLNAPWAPRDLLAFLAAAVACQAMVKKEGYLVKEDLY